MRRSVWLALGMVAVALLGGLVAAAPAAHTGRPTGKGGAVRDDGVRGQYWSASPGADQPRVMQIAAGLEPGRGLWVGGRQITDPRDLDLPPLSRLRREIIAAMVESRRGFDFADGNQLRWTIELRLQLITLMQAVRAGHGECHGVDGALIHLPASWELYPEPAGSMRGVIGGREAALAGRARSTVASAHAAIDGFRTERSVVDCLAGMQLTILDAADRVLGERNFDQAHPPVIWPSLAATEPAGAGRPYVLIGLGVPLLTIDPDGVTDNAARTALAKHLVIVRHEAAGAPPISIDDMVPGDYARLGGATAGGNVVYLGRGRSGVPYFYGYGFPDPDEPERSALLSEAKLRGGVAALTPASGSELPWTLLGGPTLYGDPRHAGRFVGS